MSKIRAGVNTMQGISDINIVGVDATRPPFIRKESYIDIFFELSHQAPKDWCKDLNSLFAINHTSSNTSINEKESLYIERIQLSSQQSGGDTSKINESSEQENLNNIISSLIFNKGD